ncbi:MAG: sigma-E processing peptidase SpoIIGA [Bacilli bacterium]|nr:sigma-E processing peptidase SpoIIGA [Bacilli bacterium]
MKIYVDLILFLNFSFDFILLLCVSLILKRKAKILSLIIGAFIGSLSTLFLFVNISSLELFIYKIFISVIMCITTFKFKNIKYTLNNLLYLYLSSIVLGGGLYLVNDQFSLKNNGLIFVNNGFSINLIILVIFSQIIIYIYIKKLNRLKNNYNHYYNAVLYINNNIYKLTAYLDTGNKLKDPYKNRPVILVLNSVFNTSFDHYLLVPYKTIDKEGVMKCIKADKIYIEGIGTRYNFLVGLINKKIEFDGINCILQENILEG